MPGPSSESESTTSITELNDAALLTEIENLHLRARLAVQGILAGTHRSLRRGASIEFSEHKLYAPGDDIRHIDWRAYAKTDRYHVKQFEDETNLTLQLLVDHSGSMRFASDALPTKLDYARALAAALSYLALRQGDAAGLIAFANEVTVEVAPRATSAHLQEILRALAGLRAHAGTGVGACLNHYARSRKRRSVVFLISDLFDKDAGLDATLRRLTARRHDVTLLHVLDPAEISFPYENPALFASLEDNRRLLVHPRTLRDSFVAEMQRFLQSIQRLCAEAGIDYQLITTQTPPAQAIAELLRRRQIRVGSGRKFI